jgi:cytidine deaminase
MARNDLFVIAGYSASMANPDIAKLGEQARAARVMAYAPYSKFRVGAALLLDNGAVVLGSNVENASYGLTCCAERVAIFSARVQHPAARIVALAVSAGDDSHPHEGERTRMPCGACRQVMVEFMDPMSQVWIDGVGTQTLAQLLPAPFKL